MNFVYGFAIIAVIFAAAFLTHLIKKADDKRRMMSHVYTTHGHILKSTLNTKPVQGIGNVGESVTSSGEFITHWSYKTYNLKSGFTVHFVENCTMKDMREGRKRFSDQPVTLFNSLRKDQEDPFMKHYKKDCLDTLDGTLSYVIDDLGNKLYVSFTPDR